MAAYPHSTRNVFGNDRVAAMVPGGPAPEGQQPTDFAELRRSALDNYKTFGGLANQRMAIRLDFMLAAFCRQRVPDALFDERYGSGPDASPWHFGHPPLWFFEALVTRLVDFKVNAVSVLCTALPCPGMHLSVWHRVYLRCVQ